MERDNEFHNIKGPKSLDQFDSNLSNILITPQPQKSKVNDLLMQSAGEQIIGSAYLDRQNQLSGSIKENNISNIENKYLNSGVTEYLIEEYGQQPLSRTIHVPNPIFSS